MKKYLFLLILLLLFFSLGKGVRAQNPFTSKPEYQHLASKPYVNSAIFAKIIIWQYRLKQKISELVHDAKATGNPKPLLFLFGLAFIYGMVHAAGPGHGKIVAMSYLISCGRKYSMAILFGNLIAFFHGLSGVLFVLFFRLLMQRTISGTLEEITHNTQLISFGLIFLLGLFLLSKSFFLWRKPNPESNHDLESKPSNKISNYIFIAFAVGVVPCPGVVLVMLFCSSMGTVLFGVIMSFFVSLGMAVTITGAVLLGLTGKKISAQLTGSRKKIAWLTERIVETLAAFLITILGLIFFMANL